MKVKQINTNKVPRRNLWEHTICQETQKASGRILFVFSTKSMLWTGGFAGVGWLISLIISMFGIEYVGMIVIAVFALIGFAIGSLKIPEIGSLEFTKKVGGENIDDIIMRAIKFKKKNHKVYIYREDETNDR